MVSIQSSGGLHLNTSQLSAQYRQRGSSTSSLSPGSPCSWKNSLEELSKGLQRICSSPSKELHSPIPTAYANNNRTSPTVENSLQRQISDNLIRFNYCPLPNLADGKRAIRVRHEESNDTLQRRLSQISGYKISSEEDVQKPRKSHQRKPSKDLAMMVAQRLSSSHNRINVTVKTGNLKQEDLTVRCHEGQLTVQDLSQTSSNIQNANDRVLHKESLSEESTVTNIMCIYGAKDLHIRERTKQVLQLDGNKPVSEEPFYCPIFTWDDNGCLWTMSWYLTEKVANQNVSVKTVDSKLVIACRSKRLSMLMDHIELSQELLRSAYSQNGVAMRNRGGIQLSLDLPEGVDARSVTAYVTQDNQLIVQGKQSGNTERCMTL